jgi:hypothetical protein
MAVLPDSVRAFHQGLDLAAFVLFLLRQCDHEPSVTRRVCHSLAQQLELSTDGHLQEDMPAPSAADSVATQATRRQRVVRLTSALTWFTNQTGMLTLGRGLPLAVAGTRDKGQGSESQTLLQSLKAVSTLLVLRMFSH